MILHLSTITILILIKFMPNYKWLKHLPDFKGKKRIIRYVLNKYIKKTSNIIIADKNGLIYKLPNIKETIGFELFVNGCYEIETIQFLIKTLPKNSNIIDVGANIGAICIPLAKCRSDIKIFAIEASPMVYKYLEYNIRCNDLEKQISCYNMAVSNVDKQNLKFYCDFTNFGKGSYTPLFTDSYEYVTTITLSTFILEYIKDKIDFIKVDIEGYEYMAFLGIESYIKKYNSYPKILFEFIDWAEEYAGFKKGEAQRYLINLGYKLKVFDEKSMSVIPIKDVKERGYSLIYAEYN